MEKYKKYYGVIIFTVTVVALCLVSYNLISPQINKYTTLNKSVTEKEATSKQLQTKLKSINAKMQKLKESLSETQKKVYSPIESDLGSDSLFFSLYDDIIEMAHVNSVQIKSLSYVYNPENDDFVKSGKDTYFVCDINMELVSNYINLGKLVQDLYQYPYYIRINSIETKPSNTNKKVLFTNLSIRLYAHTEPEASNSVKL